MKKRNVLRVLIVVCLSTALLTTGCKSKETTAAPFTELNWESTLEDMQSAYGTDYETTLSYVGDTYIYSGEYEKMAGQIRYSFADDTLASAVFIYESEDGEELASIYDSLHSKYETKYGESGEYETSATTMTDIWRLDTGNIMLVALISSDYNAIMVSYLDPSNSTSNVNNQE